MNRNEIICGDNSQVLAGFPDDCIDLTVTSPPFESLAGQLYRVTKAGGVVVWVVGDATIDGSETGTSFRQALYFMGCGFSVETMIYEVAGTGAKGSNKYYWQAFEFMFVLSKGQPKTTNRISDVKNLRAGAVATKGRIASDGHEKDTKRRVTPAYSVRTNIWRYQAGNNGDDRNDHPAVFPEGLARDHILSWSNPGDLVLDPFIGSGTTAKMAKETGRDFIGIDISEEYCKLARKRIAGANVPLFTETL